MRRDEARVDRRDAIDAAAGGEPVGVMDRRQAVVVRAVAVGERIDAAEARAQPRDGVGEVIRWQQARLAAQQRRGEADREAVAVAAHVEHVAARAQERTQPLDVGEEGGDR